jgi:hypothetical protein
MQMTAKKAGYLLLKSRQDSLCCEMTFFVGMLCLNALLVQATWFILNISIANVNKWLLHFTGFHYPVILTASHMMVGLVEQFHVNNICVHQVCHILSFAYLNIIGGGSAPLQAPMKVHPTSFV